MKILGALALALLIPSFASAQFDDEVTEVSLTLGAASKLTLPVDLTFHRGRRSYPGQTVTIKTAQELKSYFSGVDITLPEKTKVKDLGNLHLRIKPHDDAVQQSVSVQIRAQSVSGIKCELVDYGTQDASGLSNRDWFALTTPDDPSAKLLQSADDNYRLVSDTAVPAKMIVELHAGRWILLDKELGAWTLDNSNNTWFHDVEFRQLDKEGIPKLTMRILKSGPTPPAEAKIGIFRIGSSHIDELKAPSKGKPLDRYFLWDDLVNPLATPPDFVR